MASSPRAVWRLATPAVAVLALAGVAGYWWIGYGWFSPRFRVAAAERGIEGQLARQMYHYDREVAELEKKRRAPRTPIEEEEDLRAKGFVHPDEVLLALPRPRSRY